MLSTFEGKSDFKIRVHVSDSAFGHLKLLYSACFLRRPKKILRMCLNP